MTETAAPAIVFAREPLAVAWPECLPLFERHWREIAHYQDIPLEPDVTFYEAMEGAGALRIFTARADGRVVGYAFYFVRRHPHYASSIVGNQDVLFLAPEQRKGGLGRRLIEFADDALRAEGVQVAVQHVKAAHNFGPLLERLGYELQDLIFTRRLDR